MEGTSLNLDRIKAYNANLRLYKDKSSRLSAEIDVRTNELTRICDELSRDLGCTVNPANVEQIYDEYVTKISRDLEQGIAILQKIAEGEQQITRQTAQAMGQGQPTQAVAQGAAQPQGTVQTQGMAQGQSVQGTAQGQPVQGVIQGAVQPQGVNQAQGMVQGVQNTQGTAQNMGAAQGGTQSQVQGTQPGTNFAQGTDQTQTTQQPTAGQVMGMGVQQTQQVAGFVGQAKQEMPMGFGLGVQGAQQEKAPVGLFGNKYSGENVPSTPESKSEVGSGIPLGDMFGSDEDEIDAEFRAFFNKE